MFRLPAIALFLCFAVSAPAKLNPEHFPVDDAMRVRVDFWKRVYTEISSDEGFLHDSEDLSVVYETVKHPSKSRRARSRQVRDRKRDIRATLLSIYRKEKRGLTEEEAAVLRATKNAPLSRLREMARNIRYQRGLRDMYVDGLARSYRYLDKIKEIFREEGIPLELAYLPHVESSFNYRAYSKVGAAGIWQFMRSTARLFDLKISYVVDERRDPILAARAAARLLKQNYAKLQAWPLALTAYNHGAASIARAVQRVESRDISTIIERYEGRRFGFASKNFYATFVATVEISQEAEKYFPGHSREEPFTYSEILLDRPLTINQISKATGMSPETLKNYNLGLRPIVFRSPLYVPRNYRLKLPTMESRQLAQIEESLKTLKGGTDAIEPGGVHRVARGETLYHIARIYRTSLAELVALNNLDSPSRIYPGMKIRIPARETVVASRFKTPPKKQVTVAKAEPAPPAEPAVAMETSEEKSEDSETVAVASVLEDEGIEESSEEEPASAPAAATTVAQTPPAGERFPALYRNVGPFEPGKEPVQARELVSVESYSLDMASRGKGRYVLVVEPEETIGHYADWAGTSASVIRRMNRMRYGQPIRIGQKISIPLSEDKLADFNLRRMEYHLAMQEDFYSAYRVSTTKPYRVRRGDTLDRIIRENDVPLWLLRKHQPAGHPLRLVAGQAIEIPVVEPIGGDAE